MYGLVIFLSIFMGLTMFGFHSKLKRIFVKRSFC